MRTGRLEEVAVEGLRSWVGDGARLREADWRVDVRVAAGLAAMVVVVGGGGKFIGSEWEREREGGVEGSGDAVSWLAEDIKNLHCGRKFMDTGCSTVTAKKGHIF